MMDDVYAIPVRDSVLIYSPLRGLSALVNSKAAAILGEVVHGGRIPLEAGESFKELARCIFAQPLARPDAASGEIRPCFLGIIPTRACNGGCHYCDFDSSRAPHEMMDPRLAVACVDWMAETAHRFGDGLLNVHFFGGEPFVARDVVTCVVHRTRLLAARLGLKPQIEASTNGVHDERLVNWIGEYFDAIVLSLDGPADIHDAHRPLATGFGSSSAVLRTARLLGAARTQLCLRVCVSQLSVDRMKEIATWIANELSPSTVNFETVRDNAMARSCGLLPPDPFAFARGFAQAVDILVKAGIEAEYSGARIDAPRHTACPLGRDAVIVSPDGTLASCYLPRARWESRGLDFVIGSVDSETGPRIDHVAIGRLRELVLAKPKCVGCFCRWSCAGGCHVDVSHPGAPDVPSAYCVQTRMITAWILLRNMRRSDIAQALVDSRRDLECLAYQRSDSLSNWGL